MPKVEECTILSSTAECVDNRLPQGQRVIERDFRDMLGYQCTPPNDKATLERDVTEKYKELSKLRRKQKKKK